MQRRSLSAAVRFPRFSRLPAPQPPYEGPPASLFDRFFHPAAAATVLAAACLSLSVPALAQTLQPVYDLSRSPGSGADAVDVVAYGRANNDGFGRLTRTGDINGDGIDDVIVATATADAGLPVRVDAGMVAVWFGASALGGTKDTAGTVGSAPDLTILGAAANDQLSAGGALAVADVNGDGIGDLLIGAVGGDGPNDDRDGAGEAYIIFGRASFPTVIDLAGASSADVVLYGATAGDSLAIGGALIAGDVNGDGFADLLLGAPLADGPGEARLSAGEAYIILGRTTFPATLDMAIQDNLGATVTVHGAAANDFLTFGGAMAVGDLDGDGVADVILGALGGDGPEDTKANAGEACIIFGRANFPAAIDLGAAQSGADVMLYGATASDQLTAGGALATGDINGDGFTDLLLGAVGGDGPADGRDGAGEAYIVLGRAVFPRTLDLAEQNGGGADTTIHGASAVDNLTSGGALGVADVNGDGVADVILGAYQADGPAEERSNAGEAYIIFGRAVLPAVLDLAVQGEGGADVTLYGATASDNLTIGGALATGDVNGDGRADLLLGARDADGLFDASTNSGEAYLILGRGSFPATLDLGWQGSGGADVTIYGATTNDQLTSGAALALGDVNGDGFADVVLGAIGADGPGEARNNAGEAYLFFGAGAAVIGPDIGLEQPAGTNLTDGGSRLFGAHTLGTGNSRTFTIRNTGTEPVTDISVILDGPHAGDFGLDTTGMAGSLASGATTTFSVTFNAGGTGVRSAAIRVFSNDPDENPFDVTLTGTGISPRIVVEQPAGTSFESGSSHFFGAVAATRTAIAAFTIKNIGTASLTGLAVSKDGAHAGDFAVAALGSNTLAPGASTICTVTFAPTALGERGATISIASNDAEQNPFVISLAGTGVEPAPEIMLQKPSGTEITTGSPHSFGTVSVGLGSTLTVTIRNIGSADLTSLSVTRDGPNAADFAIGVLGATTVAPDDSTSFTVTFAPASNGLRSATLYLMSNDADESPFEIHLSGIAVNPEISVLQPEGFDLATGSSRAFGDVLLGAMAGMTFTITNTGVDDLTGLTISKIGAHAADFVVAGPGVLTVAPGSSTTFSVSFSPGGLGPRNTTIRIASNDADENPFLIHFAGVGVAPAIAVEQPAGTVLEAGTASISFGHLLIADPATVKSVTIRNAGTAPLTGLGLSHSGANSSDFTLGTLETTSLQPGSSTTFDITFNPSVIGTKVATLSIASNGTAQPFQILLTGVAAPDQPQFVSPPPSFMVHLGQSVSFAPVITGAEPMTYQWRKGTANIAFATGSSFTIPSVKAADTGLFSQRISNSHGTITSEDAYLGTMTRGPLGLSVKTGATLTLSCTAKTPPGTTATYAWLRNDEPLQVNARTSGVTTKTLKLTGILPEEAGTYTCQVTMNTPAGPVAGANGGTVVTVVEKPTLLPFSLPIAYVSESFPPIQVLAANNPTSFTASGLPPGVVLNKTTGVLSGKPTAPKIVKGNVESYAVKFTVSNIAGSSTSTEPVPWWIEPLPEGAVGVFNGLVDRLSTLNGGMGGTLSLVTTSKGTLTGKLTSGLLAYSFKGSLDMPTGGGNPTGRAKILRRAPLTALILDWSIDLETGKLAGTLADSFSGPATVEAWRATWNSANRAVGYEGKYTAALQPSDLQPADALVCPEGEGYALLAVSATGTAIWSGKLADGSTITSSTTVGPNGEAALHLMLYTKTGSVQGWAQINRGNGDLDGLHVDWFKAEQPLKSTTRSYKAGIPLHTLTLIGGAYALPGPEQMLLGLPAEAAPNAALTFSGAGLTEQIEQPLTITATHKAIVPANLHLVKIASLNAGTGLFNGSFTLADADPLDAIEPIAVLTRSASFNGVLVLRLGRGAGHFQLPQLPQSAGQTVKTTTILSGTVSLEALQLPPE